MAVHDQLQQDFVAETERRAQDWTTTKLVITDLVSDVVRHCMELHLSTTRLRGFPIRHAWTFDIMTAGRDPWDASAHMHLGFLPSGEWVLLGYHRGDYRLVVDKSGPLHPGVRQSFIYDHKRRQADVILNMSGKQIAEAIFSQIPILVTLQTRPMAQIRPRPRYGTK
jgi:hypothetical protein